MRSQQRTRTLILVLLILLMIAFAFMVWMIYLTFFSPGYGLLSDMPLLVAGSSGATLAASGDLPMRTPGDMPGAPIPTASPTQVDTPTATPSPSPSLTPSPTLTPTPTSSPTLDAWVTEKMANMNLKEKVGQMMLTGVSGTAITPQTCKFLQRLMPGGIVYIGANVTNAAPGQLRQFSSDLQSCMAQANRLSLLLTIDHEGQYVNRFPAGSPMTIFPAAMAIGASSDLELAYQAALASGGELAANGINMVLGPVADVVTNYDNTVISQRSFGGDPQVVKKYVRAAVSGYLDAGIIPVLKHFPGHGGVAGDSHTILPADLSAWETLQAGTLLPFEKGMEAGAPAVMMSHVAFPAIDPAGLPASLSAPLYRVLREEMGFQGIAMSDSLSMGAVKKAGFNVPDAAVIAVNAGIDMLMVISPDQAETTALRIVEAVKSGEISRERIDQAVGNILTIKLKYGLLSTSVPQPTEPEWSDHQELAYEIGYRAVSLYRNDHRLVPIPASVNKVLIVGPADGWNLYPPLKDALTQRGIQYSTLIYSGYWFKAVPETSYLQIVPARAAENDLVILFTWDAHVNRFKFDDPFQGQLVQSLVDGGYPLIVIALKSPSDILDFPQIATYLASMGTTRGQAHAIRDILMGTTGSVGVIPLPDLP